MLDCKRVHDISQETVHAQHLTAQVSSLLRCDMASLGMWFPVFQRNPLPLLINMMAKFSYETLGTTHPAMHSVTSKETRMLDIPLQTPQHLKGIVCAVQSTHNDLK